jgi:predicted metal-dependent hydrolase
MHRNASRLCELHTSRGKVLLNYRLRRNARSRYLRVSVRDTGEVIVSVPTRTSDAAAMEFLHSQGEWVLQALARVPIPANLVEHMRRQPWVSAAGRKLRVEIEVARVRTHWVADVGQGLVVIRCVDGGDPSHTLREALIGLGAELLPPYVQALAEKVGVTVDKVTVRNQRTLWVPARTAAPSRSTGASSSFPRSCRITSSTTNSPT